MRACVICARWDSRRGAGMSDDRHREYTVHTTSRPRKESSMMPPTPGMWFSTRRRPARVISSAAPWGPPAEATAPARRSANAATVAVSLALGPSSPAGSFDAGLDAAAAAAAVAVADAFVSAGTMVSTASGAGAVSAVAMLAPGSPSAEQGGRGLPSRRERCLGRAPLGRRSGTPPADARAVVAVLPAGRNARTGVRARRRRASPQVRPSPRPPSHSARTPSPPSRRYARTDGTTTARRDDASRRVSSVSGSPDPPLAHRAGS